MLAGPKRGATDLVLLDIDLGTESGLDVMRQLRADSALSGPTCIAVSTDGVPGRIEAALRAGFDDRWIKPVEIADLHQRLDTLPSSIDQRRRKARNE